MELITIRKENEKEVVSARELYEFLEFERAHWKRWSKKNIINNEFFKENKDWIGFTIMVNGNQTMDFYITIDMAKELSMLARTEKGNQARKYFIDCEKKYIRSLEEKNILADDKILREMQIEFEEINRKEKLIEQLTRELKEHYKDVEIRACIKREDYERIFAVAKLK